MLVPCYEVFSKYYSIFGALLSFVNNIQVLISYFFTVATQLKPFTNPDFQFCILQTLLMFRQIISATPKLVRSVKPNFFAVRSFAGDAFLDAGVVSSRVITVVSNFDKVDASKVTSASQFSADLGLDSLDTVEVVMAIEDEFAIEIPDTESDKILSIEDAVKYISTHPMAK